MKDLSFRNKNLIEMIFSLKNLHYDCLENIQKLESYDQKLKKTGFINDTDIDRVWNYNAISNK